VIDLRKSPAMIRQRIPELFRVNRRCTPWLGLTCVGGRR